MGDSGQSNSLSAPFPAPPSFYQHFTEENLQQLAALEKEKGGRSSLPSSELPEHLRVLRPPTPPVDGTYRSFGEERSLNAPLANLPTEVRILPHPLPNEVPSTRLPVASPSNLLRVTRSLLLSYLELLHLLQASPAASDYGQKWEDLRDLFQNAHSIVNSYRDWQGRESLIALLEGEIKRGKDSVIEWKDMEQRVEGALKNLEEQAGRSSGAIQIDEQANGHTSSKDEVSRLQTLLTSNAVDV